MKPVLKTLIIAAITIASYGIYSTNAYASCTFRPAKVNVQQKRLPLKLNRSLSAQQLTSTAHGHVGHGGIVLGHGGGGMTISGNMDYDISGSASRGYCPKIKQVNIVLEVAPEIKMARSLQPGTCEYNAVYQHEQFHVAVLERTARTAAQQLPSIVNSHLQRLYTGLARYRGNPQVMQAQIQAEFSRTLQSINQQMGSHMDSEQKKIDNPTEYARVQNSCRFDNVR